MQAGVYYEREIQNFEKQADILEHRVFWLVIA